MKLEWKIIISFSLLSVLTLSFQNCGTAMDGLTTDEALSSNSLSEKYGRDADKVSAAPFAFSASLDQMTYTSCYVSNSYNDNSIFTLRAGAYNTGGVALSQEYLNYVNNNFLPTPPEKVITSTQYKSILADSPINKGASLRLGLRAPSNLQSIVSIGTNGGGSSTPVEGIDYVNLGPILSNDKALSQLIQTPGVSQHFFQLSETLAESQVEGTLYFNQNEPQAKLFRDSFVNDALLTLTYSHPDIITGARSNDSSNPQKALGKGYRLQFAQALWPRTIGSLKSSSPNNFLVGIQETNLDGSAVDLKTWTCDPQRRYMIVRPADRATYCPKESISKLTTDAQKAAYIAELALLRRQLPANLWDINISLRCVVPKTAACYKTENESNGTLIPIEYDQTKECFQGVANVQYSSSTIPKNRCAQFVSVCLRN